MIDKNNRRLLNDVEHLRGAYINPTDDEEICQTGKIFPIVLVRYCHKSIVSNNKDNIFLQGGMIMHYYQTIILKDGRSCTLRNGTSQDGRAALNNFIITHMQTDFLLSYPDEITFNEKDEADYLQKKADSTNEIEILADIDGKIVATAGISCVGDKVKTRHRCEFGISIDKEYWGLGVGGALTRACIECAKKAGYSQMELDVVADNESAISLYKKAGFVEYGRNPNGFLSRVTGRQELLLMRLELEEV